MVNFSREVLVRKREDKWSAQEHAGHLFEVEAVWVARVQDFAADCTELAAADLSNRQTYEANHNARSIREILAEFPSVYETELTSTPAFKQMNMRLDAKNEGSIRQRIPSSTEMLPRREQCKRLHGNYS